MNKIIHGGDLDYIEKVYKIKRNEIIDFSSNTNPLGYPKSIENKIIENLNLITTYPDKNYEKLKNSILEYLNINTSIENILVGNGTTELISTFIKTIRPKKSLVVSPSYSEYKKELENINSEVNHFFLLEEDNFNLNVNKLLNSLKNVNLLVICNPNNPTGTIIKPKVLEEILKYSLNNNIMVMVDETYIEFIDESNSMSAVNLTKNYKNLFVIRGVSKFFCLPGIRLGYGICNNKNIVENINKNKDSWSVNSLANLIGINVFKDKEFIKKSIDLISNEKSKFYKFFDNINFLKYYKSYSNFILVKILNDKTTSKELFENLIKNKILIRDVSAFESLDTSFFRFCILDKEKNNFLINELNNLLK